MTKEKEVLLKDLCTRLYYGVKIWYKYASWSYEKFLTCINILDDKVWVSRRIDQLGDSIPLEEANEILIKPYLRPMSSMTKEEKEELENVACLTLYPNGIQIPNGKDYDWLNKHYFDYRGLIEKGLALEAPEGMYN